MSPSPQTFHRMSLSKRVADFPGRTGRIRGTPDI